MINNDKKLTPSSERRIFQGGREVVLTGGEKMFVHLPYSKEEKDKEGKFREKRINDGLERARRMKKEEEKRIKKESGEMCGLTPCNETKQLKSCIYCNLKFCSKHILSKNLCKNKGISIEDNINGHLCSKNPEYIQNKDEEEKKKLERYYENQREKTEVFKFSKKNLEINQEIEKLKKKEEEKLKKKKLKKIKPKLSFFKSLFYNFWKD